MMKKTGWVIALVLAVLTGCQSVRVEQIQVTDTEESQPPTEVTLFARQSGETMLAAFAEKDYKKFIAPLSMEQKKAFTEAKFKEMCEQITEQYGDMIRFRYVMHLRKAVFDDYYWQVTFAKQLKSGDPNVDGEKLETDITFHLVAAPLNQVPQILIFGFN